MKLKRSCKYIWKICKCYFLPIFLLLIGYCLLSPDYFEDKIRFVVELPWFPFNSYLKNLLPCLRIFIPTLSLLSASVFVIGLFSSSKIWRCLICIFIGGLICISNLPFESLLRFYDAFYASIAIIFIAGLLASYFYDLSRKGGAIALVLILVVILGSMLYEYLAYLKVLTFHENRWLRPEQILVCIFGIIDKQKDIADTVIATHKTAFAFYYFFHAFLAFLGGYIIIGFVSKAAVNTMLLRFLAPPDSIFWGINPESIILAKSLKDRGDDCVFVILDIKSVDDDTQEKISREHFLWVPEGESIHIKASYTKKHFFFSESSSSNVEWATALAEYVNGEPDVYIRIDDDADDSWLFRWANHDDIREKMNLHILRETSLVADVLLRDHPMLLNPGVKCHNGVVKVNGFNTFRILQIGFGAQGRMLLNRTICDAQAPATSFEAAIIDKQQDAFDLYDVHCPDVTSTYNLSFENMDVKTKEFFDWLKSYISRNNYTRINVSTNSDDLNLSVARYIVNYYRERGDLSRLKELKDRLFVRVRHPENYADFKLEKGKTLLFTTFGSDKDVYSYQNVINLDLDKVAKKINAYWCGAETKKEQNASWRNLKFFDRESSRASALGIRNLWRLAYGIDPGSDKKQEVEAKWKEVMQNHEVLNRLAEAEHLRWMAFHYVCGIRAWYPETQPKIVESAFSTDKKNLKDWQLKANQIENANSHSALISRKELFRMDVYLDIKSFKKVGNTYKLFELYAQELENQFKSAKQYPTDKDFASNKKILALNRCVYALWVLATCIDTLKMIPRAKFEEVLREFSKNAREVYNGSNFEEESDKLLRALPNQILLGDWLRWFLPKRNNEYKNIIKIADKVNRIASKTDSNKQEFYTLGNMLGNDLQIITKVPEYIQCFRNK